MPIKKYDKPNKTVQCIRMLRILKSKRFMKKTEIAYLLGEDTNNEAVIYTDIIEEGAVDQIRALCDIEVFENAKIRIMPDVHKGKGCVIGFTADLGNRVIPNIVGVDIGCGMLTVKLGKVDVDLEALDKFIHAQIPNGKAINQHKQVDFMQELESLKMLKDVRQDLKKWNRAIGSLGGGNHFIEINVDSKDNKYLVIHSGSRNLGHVVATHYQKLAIAYHSGYNLEFLKSKDELIKRYKETGKRQEIQQAIIELKKQFSVERNIPDEMCYLEGSQRADYLHDMWICQRFAELNRETIAGRILAFLFENQDFEMFHTTHNYVDLHLMRVGSGIIRLIKNIFLVG
ncbi:RtcB family protein [Fusibacter bizertensis]